MGNLYRAQILLEPEQHRALSELAQSQDRSVSDLVREIVGQYLSEHEGQKRRQEAMQALEALAQIRERLQAEYGTYPADLLAEVRTERDQDVERIWRDEG